MDTDAIVNYIGRTFAGTQMTEDSDNLFFSYAPDASVQPSGWTPFATLVVNDIYHRGSHLDRPSVFRLNIGVRPETYRKLFGKQPAHKQKAEIVSTGHDFTVLDRIMPHPVYAPMSWVCVLNPSKKTFQAVQPLLREAYQTAVQRYESRAQREQGGGHV